MHGAVARSRPSRRTLSARRGESESPAEDAAEEQGLRRLTAIRLARQGLDCHRGESTAGDFIDLVEETPQLAVVLLVAMPLRIVR